MKSDMENNEWAGDKVSLERFSKENAFTVPSGYFEEAGQRILSLIKLKETTGDNEAQVFAVPVNYFNELSANIQSRINIEAIAGTDENNFEVPTGYFEQLTQNIQSRINIEAVASADAENFSVPEGYFDNLQQQITARIAVEKLLDKEPAYTVPNGYFEKLNKEILNKTVNQETVIRKTIVRKLWASNTFKYATAACLALIVGTSVFLKEQPVAHTQTLLHKQVSDIPVNEIKDYLELNMDANDTRGVLDNDKQINIDALDADLQDYTDIN